MNTLPQRARVFGVRLLTLLGSLALALVVAELGLRCVAPQPISWLSVYEPDEVLPYRLQPLAEQQIDTGETSWRITIDALGHRNAPGATVDRAQPFLLGLGDSFAFGHGVDFEDSLYARLAAELGGGLAIRNAAVPGYGPVQYRQVLERELGEPGLAGVLVTSFLGNDFYDCVWGKEGPITDGALGATRGRRYWLKKHSHLYRFVSAHAHFLGLGRGESDLKLNARLMTSAAWNEKPLAQARDVFRTELGRMQELCRARGVPLFVLILPARASVDDALLESSAAAAGLSREKCERDLPTRTALTICAELDLPCLDASGCLRSLPAPLYFRFDGHFRPATTRALAHELAPLVRGRFFPRRSDA